MNPLREAADWIEAHADAWDGKGAKPEAIVAALRTALAEREADEALMRQALEALVLAARHDMWPAEEAQQDAAIAAVRERLEGK